MSVREFFGLESRSTAFQDLWGADLDGPGLASAAGKNVTTESALTLTAVFGCFRIIGDNVSTLDLDSLIEWDGSTKPYRPRPSWMEFDLDVLGRIAVLNQIVLSLLADGNAFVALVRSATGEVIDLVPLDPRLVEVRNVGGRIFYHAEGETFTPEDVLHIPGMMFPGTLRGVSPIAYARETIGLGLAAQEFGARFFGNGAIPGAIVETDGPVSDTGIRQMKRGWREAHEGAGNAHKLAVLTEGARFTKVSVAPDDAQFLETRQFQVADVARIYGVPPHLLADASQSTSWGSGLAEQNLAFAQHALRPWVKRIEAGFTRIMRLEARPGRPFARLDLEGVSRGSLKEQLEAYKVGLDAGVYSVDEVRSFLGHAPLPNGEGEKHRVPLNTTPIGVEPPAPSTRSEESPA